MSVDWASYDAQLSLHGKTTRDRLLSYEREALVQKMLASPAMKQIDIDGQVVQMLILSTDMPNEKRFQLLPGDIVNIGNIVIWNEMHWLVTQVDFDDELTRSGRIVQCNRQIRWQNPVTKELIERWCLMTKPYTTNVNNGITISNSNRELKVQVPFDSETKIVDVDKRFMLEAIDGRPRTYTVVSVDQQTNKYEDIDGGFIVWNLKQDEAGRPNDSLEFMICDYVLPEDEVSSDPSPLLSCSIMGRNILRAGVGSREYKACFYLSDGVTESEEIKAVWSVEISPQYQQSITWSADESKLKISALESAIGQTIHLLLTDENGEYSTAEMIVEVIAPI